MRGGGGLGLLVLVEHRARRLPPLRGPGGRAAAEAARQRAQVSLLAGALLEHGPGRRQVGVIVAVGGVRRVVAVVRGVVAVVRVVAVVAVHGVLVRGGVGGVAVITFTGHAQPALGVGHGGGVAGGGVGVA